MGAWSTLAWLAAMFGGIAVVWRVVRKYAHGASDSRIDALIAANAARTRFGAFDPALRDNAAVRRRQADEQRQQANRLCSTPSGPQAHETVPFRRAGRGGIR